MSEGLKKDINNLEQWEDFVTPIDALRMNKITNKIISNSNDIKILSDAMVNLQPKNDNNLETTNKNIPSAINELKREKFDKVTITGNVVKFYANNIEKFSITLPENQEIDLTEINNSLATKYDNVILEGQNLKFYVGDVLKKTITLPDGEGGSVDLSGYQTKNDSALTTKNKTISGAINEINNVVNGKANNDHTHVIADVEGLQEALDNVGSGNGGVTETVVDQKISDALDGHTFRFLTQAEYDSLSENEKYDKTIVYQITDAQEDSYTLSYVNSTLSLKNNGEEISSVTIESGSNESIDFSSYQTKTDETLTTKDKTIVGAINEVNSKVDSSTPSEWDGFLYSENGNKFRLVVSNEGALSAEQVIVPIYGELDLGLTGLSVAEGSTNTFAVKLATAPNVNEVISLSVNNSNCTLSANSLTFNASNYNTPQIITVNGVHDNTSMEDKSSVITLSNEHITSKTINVTITNIDEEVTPPTENNNIFKMGRITDIGYALPDVSEVSTENIASGYKYKNTKAQGYQGVSFTIPTLPEEMVEGKYEFRCKVNLIAGDLAIGCNNVDNGGSLVESAFTPELSTLVEGNEYEVSALFDCHADTTGFKISFTTRTAVASEFDITDIVLVKQGMSGSPAEQLLTVEDATILDTNDFYIDGALGKELVDGCLYLERSNVQWNNAYIKVKPEAIQSKFIDRKLAIEPNTYYVYELEIAENTYTGKITDNSTYILPITIKGEFTPEIISNFVGISQSRHKLNGEYTPSDMSANLFKFRLNFPVEDGAVLKFKIRFYKKVIE